jgi:hypothetical protein
MPPKNPKVTQSRGQKRPLPVNENNEDSSSTSSLSTVSSTSSLSTVSGRSSGGSRDVETGEFESFIPNTDQPGVSLGSLKERSKLLLERLKLLGTDFEGK